MNMEKDAEVERLKKLIQQFQGIVNTSRDSQAIARAKKELREFTLKLENLLPGAAQEILQKSNPLTKQKSTASLSLQEKMGNSEIFSRYKLSPVDESCTDNDVSIVALILNTWEENFSSAMSDQHLKLYYSHAAERDSHFRYYNSMTHNLDGLIKVCKDYMQAPNEEFKQQFREVKERSIRQFLHDSIAYLEKIKDFWQKLDDDIKQGGSICLNQNEVIHLTGVYENKGFLDGVSVVEAVSLAAQFFKDGIALISLPIVKKK